MNLVQPAVQVGPTANQLRNQGWVVLCYELVKWCLLERFPKATGQTWSEICYPVCPAFHLWILGTSWSHTRYTCMPDYRSKTSTAGRNMAGARALLPRNVGDLKTFENAMTLDIDRLSRKVPQLCKVAPSTPKYHMQDVHTNPGQ